MQPPPLLIQDSNKKQTKTTNMLKDTSNNKSIIEQRIQELNGFATSTSTSTTNSSAASSTNNLNNCTTNNVNSIHALTLDNIHTNNGKLSNTQSIESIPLPSIASSYKGSDAELTNKANVELHVRTPASVCSSRSSVSSASIPQNFSTTSKDSNNSDANNNINHVPLPIASYTQSESVFHQTTQSFASTGADTVTEQDNVAPIINNSANAALANQTSNSNEPLVLKQTSFTSDYNYDSVEAGCIVDSSPATSNTKVSNNNAHISGSLMQHHISHSQLNHVDRNQYMNDEDLNEYKHEYAFVPDSPQSQVTLKQEDPVDTMFLSNISKSAPTTPCNVTPIAFHPHHLMNGAFNLSPANTLPPDLRKNIINNSPEMSSTFTTAKQLDGLLKKGITLLKKKDYTNCLNILTECIKIIEPSHIDWPDEFLVYYYRAETNFCLENYVTSLEDAKKAIKLNPKCMEAYYRQARAQLCLEQHQDSLATFAYGLAQNPFNTTIFKAFVETARQSKFKSSFEPKYKVLEKRNLHRQPFIIASVVGQELLEHKHYHHAIVVLESALHIGTDNIKHRGSVYSALASACWANRDREKAIAYMQEDSKREETLKDPIGQCRAYCNLGFAYFSSRKYSESLDYLRKAFNLSLSTNAKQAAIILNALGHVHVARYDYNSALTSHSNCLGILKDIGESNLDQARELCSIGHIYAMMGDFEKAEENYLRSLNLIDNSKESNKEATSIIIMIYFNSAYIAMKKNDYQQAQNYYKNVIDQARSLGGIAGERYEMRASCGLGHAHRIFKTYPQAEKCFERQLKLADSLKDRAGKSQALCNLGMLYQYYRSYGKAAKLFEENLELVGNDTHLLAYAYSYMGGVYCCLGKYSDSIQYFKKSAENFQKLGNCDAELSTIDLNLKFVYEKVGHSDLTIRSTGSCKIRSPYEDQLLAG